MEYRFPLYLDMCNAVPEVNKILREINKSLAESGFPEVYLHGAIPIGAITLTTDHPLNSKEKIRAHAILKQALAEKTTNEFLEHISIGSIEEGK